MITPTCCFFPTTVLMVDDNKPFLSTLSLLIDQYIPTVIETDPLQAIEVIEKNYLKPTFIQECTYSLHPDNIEENDSYFPLFHINIQKLLAVSHDPGRFSSISLLLVDYSMPNMTGEELCKRLSHIPIKKAMVTGEADLNIAVDLFNAGIINKFIVKDSPQFYQQIKETITELQCAYFKEISKPLIDQLKISENILDHPAFHLFFKKNQQRLNAIEYYLLDNQGSFLFLDKKGTPTIIAIKPAQEIERYYYIAQDNDAPQEIISLLHKKAYFPFFLTEKHLKAPLNQWHNFLFETRPIPGMDSIYYAEITFKEGDQYFKDKKWQGIIDYFSEHHYVENLLA